MKPESPEKSDPVDDRPRPGREEGESGAGGEGASSAPVPFAPDEDDDSPLGDTDQHSDA